MIRPIDKQLASEDYILCDNDQNGRQEVFTDILPKTS